MDELFRRLADEFELPVNTVCRIARTKPVDLRAAITRLNDATSERIGILIAEAQAHAFSKDLWNIKEIARYHNIGGTYAWMCAKEARCPSLTAMSSKDAIAIHTIIIRTKRLKIFHEIYGRLIKATSYS